MPEPKDQIEEAVASDAVAGEPDAAGGKTPLSDAQLESTSGGLTIFVKDTISPGGFFPTAWQVIERPRGY